MLAIADVKISDTSHIIFMADFIVIILLSTKNLWS